MGSSAPPVSCETSGPAAVLVARAGAMGIAISPGLAGRLVALLDRIALEPQNLTAIEDVHEGVDRHLADSLAGLGVPALDGADSCVDLGSGVGFPGLAIAMARPRMSVTLVESEKRKAEWLHRATADFPNVRVVAERSEHLASAEREQHAMVTARALGPLAVTLELAAPLVAPGGGVLVWRGDRADRAGEAAAVEAARALGLEPEPPVASTPFPGARRRLHLFRKARPTPSRFPRRPGRAASRPLGGTA